MTRVRRRASSRVCVSAATLLGAFASCVAAAESPTTQSSASVDEIDLERLVGCPYLNVLVQWDYHGEKQIGWERAEPLRRQLLRKYAVDLPNAGFRLVDTAAEAAFTLGANGGEVEGEPSRLYVMAALRPSVVILHHIFIASIANKSFPYSIDFGGGRSVTTRVAITDAQAEGVAKRFTQAARERSLATVSALCETRAALIKEGIAIEALRRELILEMERVREEHAERTRQRKELELQIEKPAAP